MYGTLNAVNTVDGKEKILNFQIFSLKFETTFIVFRVVLYKRVRENQRTSYKDAMCYVKVGGGDFLGVPRQSISALGL